MREEKLNISVIVPIYNVEPYLSRCVDSILAQTCQDYELILVDDGSPDGCGAICDQYALRDSRIKVIHKANGGLSDARNAGLEIAQGEYIAFIDSDDWVTPDYLAKLLNGLAETGADICECEIIRTDGSVSVGEETLGETTCYDTQCAMQLLIQDTVLRQHVWNKLYRRDTIGDTVFPNGKTNEDEFWTYQVFGRARKVTKIQNVLYSYFQRPESIMGKTYSLKRLDALEAKMQRQKYIQMHFPDLTAPARHNLYESCIYAGQMSLLHLSKEDLADARSKIDMVLQECRMTLDECLSVSGSNKVWFSLAWVSFWRTCWLKNLLRKGL